VNVLRIELGLYYCPECFDPEEPFFFEGKLPPPVAPGGTLRGAVCP
jgi:hypothetical protein